MHGVYRAIARPAVEPTQGVNVLRSVAVVLASYVAMVVVVMVGTAVAAAALLPNGLASMRTPTSGTVPTNYLSANLVVSLMGAVLAGWLVARFAASNVNAHAVALGILLLFMGLVSARMTPGGTGQPTWYPWALPLIGLAGIALGVALRSGQ